MEKIVFNCNKGENLVYRFYPDLNFLENMGGSPFNDFIFDKLGIKHKREFLSRYYPGAFYPGDFPEIDASLETKQKQHYLELFVKLLKKEIRNIDKNLLVNDEIVLLKHNKYVYKIGAKGYPLATFDYGEPGNILKIVGSGTDSASGKDILICRIKNSDKLTTIYKENTKQYTKFSYYLKREGYKPVFIGKGSFRDTQLTEVTITTDMGYFVYIEEADGELELKLNRSQFISIPKSIYIDPIEIQKKVEIIKKFEEHLTEEQLEVRKLWLK